jgi:two-component system, response regulator
MKIIVIDDEVDIGFILGFELRNLGHQTVIFESAQDAVTYLETEKADAILCDLQMPRMSGMELLKWTREKGMNIPFYFLTGEPSMNVEELKNEGVQDVLFKPQDLQRLASIFK